MGEREALSVAEAAGRGVRGGGCVRRVRDEARGHVIGGSPQARMRAGGGHRPREGMRRRLRAGASAVEDSSSLLRWAVADRPARTAALDGRPAPEASGLHQRLRIISGAHTVHHWVQATHHAVETRTAPRSGHGVCS